MARLIARDKYLYDGGGKFYARGVSYGTFAPNSRGDKYPEPQRVAADFALMRELGVNVIRVYEPAPPWMFELAAQHSLRLMVSLLWPSHTLFLETAAGAREIRDTVARLTAEMRPFREAIFSYSLGNEISPDLIRWYGMGRVSRFVAELYDTAKNIDPEGLFTYSNYPSAEYLELGFLDLICFNVYLHREADFRRYLTHLLAITGDRPLVLSETGMDTIREGEAHQAQLLQWQARAAFELGLCGFIIFAFTDEWYRGGMEITDWAFGIVDRERKPKQAFAAVAQVYAHPLPPPLDAPPAVSVIVAAYNAEATLGACLESLARLDYPEFEVIVVDDGSTDRTRAIAQQAGVKVLSLPHQGLSAARNTGLSAATGEIAAFIDADAAADRDWLYHLVEAIRRRAAAAAGGPNFPPAASSILAAAIAAAPGQPREVRQSDDSLAQVCGCNMAVVRAVAQSLGGFDPLFTAAGDDVDFSWRLLRARAVIAYAPGAVVTHERRGSIRAYLAQQRGYGAAEALLARKYPELGRRRVYGYDGWQARWLGLPRIYYGAMGRGLFQTIYPAGGQPLVELASSAWWLALSLVLLASGIGGRQSVLIAAGGAGLILTATSAAVYAARARLERQRDRLATRALVALLSILGPAIRSYARIRAALWHALSSPKIGKAGMPRRSGSIRLAMAAREGADQPDRDAVAEQLRYALFRRGLTVEGNTGFEPFDLQIMLGSMVRVPLNTLAQEDGGLYLHWRVAASPIPILIAAAIVLGLIATGQWIAAGAAAAAAIAWCAIVAIAPLSRLPSVLGDGLIEAMDRLQVDATVISEGA